MVNNGRNWPGLAVVASIAALAYGLAGLPGLQRQGLGPLTLAIALGLLCGNLWPARGQAALRGGLALAQRHLLRVGVALYGFNLSAQQIAEVGLAGIGVDLLVVASTLWLGWQVGRRLGLDRATVLLTAAGSAICGAAAVAATAPLLGLDERTTAEKSAVAVATVVLFGTLAMLLYPLLFSVFPAGDFDVGRYVGSTVHEVAQVVAIGSALGEGVAQHAVIAKMIRVMLLVPFLLLVVPRIAVGGTASAADGVPIPWFALAFVACAGVNSLAILPEALVAALRQTGLLALTAAMAALGWETRLGRVVGAGVRPLVLGAILFAHLTLGGWAINRLLG